MPRINHLKIKVLKILEEYPKSRDSDQWLTIKLWCVYYPSRIKRDENNKPYAYLSDIMEFAREDNVKRIRAHIQNVEGKFLPTSWEVAKQRKINEEVWKNYFRATKTLW